MPGFPHPGRPGGEHDEPLLDMIFDGRAIPPDAPREMHDLQRMLAALAGPAEPGELAGEAAARAALIRLAPPASISPAASRPAAHRAPRRPVSRRSRRQAARSARRRAGLPAALCAAAALVMSAAAAYADVLPGPIQQVAHATVGAPAPRHHGAPSSARPGPRRDTRRGPGPGGPPTSRPDRAADWSPGHARVAKPGREPPRTWRQRLVPWCQPGPRADQGQPGIVSGLRAPPPPPRGPRCSDDPDQPAGRGTMDQRLPG